MTGPSSSALTRRMNRTSIFRRCHRFALKQPDNGCDPGRCGSKPQPAARLHCAQLGALAQLGERRLCKPEVTGSIPVRSITDIAQTNTRSGVGSAAMTPEELLAL